MSITVKADKLDESAAQERLAQEDEKSMRRVVMASVIGTTVEWYDFLLYGTAAALVFNKIFFPGLDPLMGTLAALGCQVAAGVGGGLAPMLATWLLARQGHYWGVAVMVVLLALVTLWATRRSPETYRDDLTQTQ